MVVTIGCLFKSKTTPFTGDRSVLMSTIKLDVLHGVAKRNLIHTGASCYVTMYFDDW